MRVIRLILLIELSQPVIICRVMIRTSLWEVNASIGETAAEHRMFQDRIRYMYNFPAIYAIIQA